jgi:NAD(P)-dependent dehydrogenase (short-subunit alcohol dehydrogenase family)
MEPSAPLAILLGIGPLIGAALARRFARGGFRTALVGLDPVLLETLAADLPGARGYVRDLGEPGAVSEVMAAIARAQGEARVLVWHASAGARGTASALDPQVLARDLRLNAVAPLEAVQQVLPAMRRAGQGTLLFTGGGLALKPEVGLASGSAGKAALRQLALCLAAELAPEGIHAATVTVAGFVQPGTPFDPERVAQGFWELHAEPRDQWRDELVLRP